MSKPPISDADRARSKRNLWIALALGAFVLLVFAITIVQIRNGILAGAS